MSNLDGEPRFSPGPYAPVGVPDPFLALRLELIEHVKTGVLIFVRTEGRNGGTPTACAGRVTLVSFDFVVLSRGADARGAEHVSKLHLGMITEVGVVPTRSTCACAGVGAFYK
jgi:hypothetical protein